MTGAVSAVPTDPAATPPSSARLVNLPNGKRASIEVRPEIEVETLYEQNDLLRDLEDL